MIKDRKLAETIWALGSIQELEEFKDGLARNPHFDEPWLVKKKFGEEGGCVSGTLLHVLARHGTPEILKYFLSITKTDLNYKGHTYGFTPLHSATKTFGTAEKVGMLLQAGADPTIRDKMGRTPLDLAIEEGYPTEDHEAIIRVLSGVAAISALKAELG